MSRRRNADSEPVKRKKSIVLKIDTREHKAGERIFNTYTSCAAEVCGEEEVQKHIKKKSLPAGDFCFYKVKSDGNEKLLFIVERKTWPDYQLSYDDGRLETQKRILHRIRGDEGVPFAYVIEGSPLDLNPRSKTTRQLLEAYIYKMVVESIPVFLTSDVYQTGEHIFRIFHDLEREKPLMGVEFKELAHKSSNKPIDWWTKSIALIPGVSVPIAQAISSKYGSQSDLMQAAYSGKLKKLEVHRKSTTRRVGPKLEQKILDYLTGNKVEEENDALDCTEEDEPGEKTPAKN